MTSAYLFCLLSLVSLPATLNATGWLPAGFFPRWLIAVSLIGVVAWIAQTFLQLVLLPVIMVGQNVQAEAADARMAKMFEHVEEIRAQFAVALDRLDTTTEGGLKDVLDAVQPPRPAGARTARPATSAAKKGAR